jgi:lipoyl(octanoyl) transferase
MNSLRLIRDAAHDGWFNMAADLFLLRNSIQNRECGSVLRFYRFSEPTWTVGYGAWRVVRLDQASRVPVIRRSTGGGIVCHGTDLTYSLIVPIQADRTLARVRESYISIHQVLKQAFADMGISLTLYEHCGDLSGGYCFETPVFGDVMLGNRKIAGAGQKRSFHYLLHQGSIAWEALRGHFAHLDEFELCARFADRMAQFLKLPLKEIPFSVEDLDVISEALSRGYAGRSS